MKARISGILLLVILTCSFQKQHFQNDGKVLQPEQFMKLIDTLGITFEMPVNYTAIAVHENGDLKYLFAIKNDTADFEIRYSIWPLKVAEENYLKTKSDTTKVQIDPNKFFRAVSQANILNMTNGKGARFTEFPPSAVKTEFNADAGGSSFFELNCGFGKGYTYGQMIIIHKDNVADVLITYLSNNKETHPNLMLGAFHAIKFK